MMFFSILLTLSILSPSTVALKLTGQICEPIQLFLDFVTRTPPRIPQFILDNQHPWIKENKYWIQRLPDSHHALCSLDSPYRPPQPSGITYPKDLYTKLVIGDSLLSTDRAGWENARALLEELQKCPAALNDIENLQVDIYIPLDLDSDHKASPPPELLQLFVDVLNAMSNLRHVYWKTSGRGYKDFENAFSQANLTLTSVRSLELGEKAGFLIPFCPNVEKLEDWEMALYSRSDLGLDPELRILEWAKELKKLTTMKLSFAWDVKLAEAMLDAMPQLKVLRITGLKRNRYYDEPEMETGDELKALLEVLKKFPNLEHVMFPESLGLYVGFEGGPWCGNEYFGPGGRELGRRVSKGDAEFTEKAAGIIISVLPGLKSFKIGSYSPTLDATGSGTPTMVWPWTGRMKEWTYEEWPHRLDEGDREL
ncbi:hypothetical protein H072_9677 [Dactylellina haptotyla CBS 200.50]|uniref:Uncharacterized protein n=1 Tax=Dactylellina haptotyla (strain CBS 200.50) TaxID=1284197 RepID=S8A1N0_DACHA|nr:hypothetical protein H072_9677 [Dactylellina haptotyla CBS 200.50]